MVVGKPDTKLSIYFAALLEALHMRCRLCLLVGHRPNSDEALCWSVLVTGNCADDLKLRVTMTVACLTDLSGYYGLLYCQLAYVLA